MLKFYARFEINDESGDALTDHDMTQLHYSKIISLQVIALSIFSVLSKCIRRANHHIGRLIGRITPTTHTCSMVLHVEMSNMNNRLNIPHTI